ncbi:hypothetical protein BC831DRAFT_442518 [Entophlyctis helioformis]|nr:hypothetical protein BC831DRAFT_442518 [Entophlyctis helioformis]
MQAYAHGTVLDTVILPLAACGTVLNMLLIGSIARSRSLRRRPETILNMNLAALDLVYSIVLTVKHSIFLAVGRDHSFLGGVFGCKVDAIIRALPERRLQPSTIAIQNYLQVVPNTMVNLTSRTLLLWSAGIWAFGATLAISAFIDSTDLILQPSGANCSYSYTSTKPLIVLGTLVDAVGLVVCIGIIITSYTLIYIKLNQVAMQLLDKPPTKAESSRWSIRSIPSLVLRAFRLSLHKSDSPNNGTDAPDKTRKRHNRSASTSAAVSDGTGHDKGTGQTPCGTQSQSDAGVDTALTNPRMLRMRLAVVHRATIISIGFIIGWIPLVITSFYQLFTHNILTPMQDAIVIVCACLIVVTNPVIFFTIDTNYRKALFNLLRLSSVLSPTNASTMSVAASARITGSKTHGLDASSHMSKSSVLMSVPQQHSGHARPVARSATDDDEAIRELAFE